MGLAEAVRWDLFAPTFALCFIGFVPSYLVIRVWTQRWPREVKDANCRAVAHAVVSYIFAVIIVVAASYALATAPANFAAPEELYRDFPVAHPTIWISAGYFAYDVLVQTFLFQDPLMLVHGLFSGGGALLSGLSPRSQNMYCWLLAFNEASSVAGLQIRQSMLRLGLAKEYPTLFSRVEMVYFVVFLIGRIFILLPRYLYHFWLVGVELRGGIPGVPAPQSPVNGYLDVGMSAMSALFNLYWAMFMVRKALVRFGYMSPKGSEKGD